MNKGLIKDFFQEVRDMQTTVVLSKNGEPTRFFVVDNFVIGANDIEIIDDERKVIRLGLKDREVSFKNNTLSLVAADKKIDLAIL